MPLTQDDLRSGLTGLGLRPGDHVLVHSALSSFGPVSGGADAVIDALLAAVEGGTVVVPTLTGNYTLSPANPPTFDPRRSPCWTGRIPETLRQRPAAVRSLHPTHSVAAIGTQADALVRDHLESLTPCDERSPYGWLARHANGCILLIGVTHDSSTMFHHVEELAGVDYHLQTDFARCTIWLDERVIERHYLLHHYGPARRFDVLEPLLIERGIQVDGQIGGAHLRLIRAGPMVELALRGLRANPRLLLA